MNSIYARRTRISFIVSCLLLIPSLSWGDLNSPSTRALVESFLKPQLSQPGLGLIYAIVDHTGNSLVGGIGSKAIKADGSFVPLSGDSTVRIASVSKIFTAIRVFQLIDEGRLQLDTPVVSILPELSLAENFGPDTKCRTMTVSHLLSHTAGLSRNVPYGDFSTGSAWPSAAAYTPHLSGIQSEFLPGEVFKYSNAGYMILGRVIAKLDSGDWQGRCGDSIAKKILVPIGMTQSGFEFGATDSTKFVHGYSVPLVEDFLRDSDWIPSLNRYRIPTYLSVGGRDCDDGLATTGPDIVKFMSALLSQMYGKPSSLNLSQTNFIKMLEPLFRSDISTANSRGFQWNELGGIGHGGFFSGFRITLNVYPAAGFAIFLAMSASEKTPIDEILRLVLPKTEPVPEVTPEMQRLIYLRQAAPYAMLAHVGPRPNVSFPVQQAQELQGKYVSKFLGALDVVAYQGSSLASFDLQFYSKGIGDFTAFKSKDADVFQISEGSMTRENVYFERGPDGRVVSLIINKYLRFYRVN